MKEGDVEPAIVGLARLAIPFFLAQEKASWDYDREADVLYITLRRAKATDSDMTDDGIVLRYVRDELVGVTVPSASLRIGSEGIPFARGEI